jgi:mannosyltransferase
LNETSNGYLQSRAWTLPPWALPVAIGAAALLLRLHALGDKPFWLDEVTTLRRATAGIQHLTLDALHARHYPSYFILMWLVAWLGHSEFLLRLPSAVFGAVGAAVSSAIGRRAAGWHSGTVAGVLMALSPFEVQLGQEARSYTLVSCLILVALWGLVRLCERPAASGLPWPQSGLRRPWLAYALGTAGALSVLGVAIPWLIASNLAAVAIVRHAGAARRAFLRKWGFAQLFILAAWAPSLIALLLFNEGGIAKGAEWAPPATAAHIWSTLAPVYVLRMSDFIRDALAPAAVPGLSFVVAALAALGAWRLRRSQPILTMLLCAAFFLPLALLLLSPFVPLLVPRYFAWGDAPFFVLVGTGLGGASWRAFIASSTALAAACLLNLLPYYGYETKPRWDTAARELAEMAKAGDVVLVNRGYTYYVFDIYAKRERLAERGLKIAHHLRQAKAWAAGHDVWTLYGRIGQGDIVPPEDYLRSLAVLGQTDAEYHVGHYITLYHFKEPAGWPNAGSPAAAQD